MSKPLTEKAEASLQHLIDTILGQVEDTSPDKWSKPWAMVLCAETPANAVTSKRYNGGNWLMMSLTALEHEWTAPWWGTYRQWGELGNQVLKGEEGTVGIRPQLYHVCRECGSYVVKRCKKPGHETKTFTKWHVFYAFHLTQTEGDWVPPTVDLRTHNTIADVEDYLGKLPVTLSIDTRNEAYFMPEHPDHIYVPAMEQFDTIEDFYSTVFHELGHLTGTEARTGRHKRLGDRFWDDTLRGQEEFVAELTAAMVGHHFDCIGQTVERHTEYLANWLHYTRNTPQDLLTACAQATKASEWLLAFDIPDPVTAL